MNLQCIKVTVNAFIKVTVNAIIKITVTAIIKGTVTATLTFEPPILYFPMVLYRNKAYIKA